MIRLEELKKTYGVQNVPPYGPCIVIPGDKFNPDWEVFLSDQGYACHFVELGHKPVTLVELKEGESTNGHEVEEVSAPPKEVTSRKPPWLIDSTRWTPDEDKKLVSLWNQQPKLNRNEIAAHFPKRTAIAVKLRFGRLQKNRQIRSRWTKGSKKAKKSTIKSVPESTISHQEDRPSNAPGPEITTREQRDNKPSALGFTTTINIQLCVDASNPAAVDGLLRFLKEART